MEKLRIYYSFKGNGISFGTKAGDYDILKSLFPEAQPAMSIFVEYDRKTDFKNYHAQLENYIFPALAGFPKAEDLKKISTVEFLLLPGFKVTHTINNYDKEVQLIRG
jgi:hypothetical protein